MEDFINQLYRSYEDNVDDDDREEGDQEPAPKKAEYEDQEPAPKKAKYEEESQADTFAEDKEKTMK